MILFLSRVIEQSLATIAPISLTPVIIKVLERIVRKQIVAFLISKEYLYPTQHGCKGGRSCLSALLNVFDDIIDIMSGINVSSDCSFENI